MNSFFKNVAGLSAFAVVLTASLATSAAAQCVAGPMCTPPTTVTPPAPAFSSFAVIFEGYTAGNGSAFSELGGSPGAVGETFASRDSGSLVNFEAFLESDLCVTDCADGGFNASVGVYESVASGGSVENNGGPGTSAAIRGTSETNVFGGMAIAFPGVLTPAPVPAPAQ